MNKLKLVLLMVVMTVTTKITFGQVSFSHALGGAFYLSDLASSPALVYSPRLNFVELNDEMTISAGTHLGFGFNYSTDGTDNYFAYELPIVAELNLGNSSSPNSDASFGGFAGLGYALNKMGNSSVFGASYNNAAGLYVNAGLRALINDRPIGLRVSYLMNSKVGFTDVLGVSLFYSFE